MLPEYPTINDKIPLAATIIYPGGVLRTILKLEDANLGKTSEAAKTRLAQDPEYKEWSEAAGQSTFRKSTVRVKVGEKWYAADHITNEKTLLELIGLMTTTGVPEIEFDFDIV